MENKTAAEPSSTKAATPRTARQQQTTRRRQPVAAAADAAVVAHASTTAVGGHSNLYSQPAPFGSGLARFSPSMTFSHHAPKHRPELHDRKANRRWVPNNLRDASASGIAGLATLTGTDASSRLAGSGRRREEESDDGQSSRAPGSTTSTSTSATASSNGGRPKSAKEEQRRFLSLRQEVTALREQKLAALEEAGERPSTPRTHAATPRVASLARRPGAPASARGAHDANACAPGPCGGRGRLTRGGEDGCLIDVSGEEAPQKQMVVPLERLEVRPGTRPYCNSQEPLERVARIVRAGRENQAPRCPHDSHEARDEISPSYADLLAFVAGEARTR